MIDPILITGCARSGTSMIAGIFKLCGAFGGVMRGPNNHNPKGMFENAYIVDQIIKPHLIKIGADPMGQKPLPDVNNNIEIWKFKEKIELVFKSEGYIKGPWFYKGAKMCLIWKTWRTAFPHAQWIIVRRPDESIINSCLHTSFMRAYNTVDGWQGWVDHHKDRFTELKEIGAIELWSNRVVKGDFSDIKVAVERAGLQWNEAAVADFVSIKLWTH